MDTIKTPGNKITESAATDLMFDGFREAVRSGMVYAQIKKGLDLYGVDVKSLPANSVNGCKVWSVRLYKDAQLVATGFADEYDL